METGSTLPDRRSDDQTIAPKCHVDKKYSHWGLCFLRPVSTAGHRTTMPIGRKRL